MAENYKFRNYDGAEMAELFDKISDLDVATESQSGLMSDTDKTKLDELPAGAQENVLEGVQLAGTDLEIVGKKVNIPVDNTPTAGSASLIRSGAVATALANAVRLEEYDVSDTEMLAVNLQNKILLVSVSDNSISTAVYLLCGTDDSSDTIVKRIHGFIDGDESLEFYAGTSGSNNYIAPSAPTNKIMLAWLNGSSAVEVVDRELSDTQRLSFSVGADKDLEAIVGNLAEFDENGNPVDSGIPSTKIGEIEGEVSELPVEKGTGVNSVQQKGTGAVASGEGSVALGKNSFTGQKAYKYTNTGNVTNQLTLTSVEGLSVGDVVSIVNDSKYPDCSTITGINGTTLTLDSLPFTSIVPDLTGFDDYLVYVSEKPTIGDVGLAIAAHAEGIGTKAQNYTAHAEGKDTQALGEYSHAEGRGTVAQYAAHAEGRDTKAVGSYSHAEGRGTETKSVASHAEGADTKAIGSASHSEGKSTIANGYASHSEGGVSVTGGDYQSNTLSALEGGAGAFAHAEGNANIAKGKSSHAEGQKTFASGSFSHAEGINTNAIGADSHAEGANTIANNNHSHAEGSATKAYGVGSHSEGVRTYTNGDAAHAEGYETWAGIYVGDDGDGVDISISAPYSHTEGQFTFARGRAAHAEGIGDNKSFPELRTSGAFGIASHSEGVRTLAEAQASHSEGQETKSTGTYAHSEGYKTEASGSGSHAEGFKTIASEIGAHAEGYSDSNFWISYEETVIASGKGSHAEGYCQPGGAEGFSGIIASGHGSHAEGYSYDGDKIIASGDGSHAEGIATKSHADGSHAEGCYTEVYGVGSHSEGWRTITSNIHEHAEGRYNKSNKASGTYGNAGNTQHSVGIGTANNARKNAFEIMQNGDAYLLGFGGYNGTNPSSATPINTILTGANKMVVLTQAQYDALSTKDAKTLYFIK